MLNLDVPPFPDGMPTFRFERAAPAGIQAYAALRHAIVTLRLRPGQLLSEQGIAQQLRTSRTPVREAFIKLAEAGLFEVLPQRGTFVRKISLKAVEDARFVRGGNRGRRAARGGWPAQPRLLRHDARPDCRPAHAAAGNDLDRFMALDDAFHRSFADAVGRSHAWTVVEAQKAQMDRVRYLSLPGATPIDRLIDQHETILDAAERGDTAVGEAGDADAPPPRCLPHWNRCANATRTLC